MTRTQSTQADPYPVVETVDFSTVNDAVLVGEIIRTTEGTAAKLLEQVGGLHHLGAHDVREYAHVRGIGEKKARQIAATLELAKRLEAGRDIDRKAFVSSTDVARYFMPRLRDLRKEVFLVLLLDARNCLIRGVTISMGSLTASVVHPREVFKPAILDSAASVIFVHNHPSGDPTPSQDDLKITAQLVDAGAMIDIKVLDHIIIGRTEFTSLAGKGLI